MAKKWISSLEDARDTKSRVAFRVLLKSNQEIIGVVSLVSISGTKAELGYWVGEEYWGNEYWTEAKKALIQLASEQLQITLFVAEHYIENPASGKVIIKLRMDHLGTMERKDRNGKPAQVEIYEVILT